MSENTAWGVRVDEPTGVSDEPHATSSPTTNFSIENYDVREVVLDNFDEHTWRVVEVVLSVHATLFICGLESCYGLIVEGPSGSGKSTALACFEGLPSQFYRTDDVTPASFVSHDASRDAESLEQDDLLPRIRHKTLLNPEMANWFAGDWGTRKEKMARLVRVMDGRGFTSDSGTHGQRGYDGDYRFNFVGATTPLDEKDWEMMGHTGNRFVFIEMPARDDESVYRDIVFGEQEYGDKVRAVKRAVGEFLRDLWSEYGGPNSVKWSGQTSDEVGDGLISLAKVIRHGRAPLDSNGDPQPESPQRVIGMIQNLARGHALLDGRTQVETRDLNVCARVALSTSPASRRAILREILQLEVGSYLRTNEVMERIDVSRPTALKRMDLMETLGIGFCDEVSVQGGQTTRIGLNPELKLPSQVIQSIE